ncbi:hypothetical protein MBLNU230_g7967t1 [Neophaeotheca triangularis]
MAPKAKPPAADLADALKKKGGLTLTQLADYDDLITDALVDRVYYWAKIRKLRAAYHPSRRIKEPDVCEILREQVIVRKDAAKAQALLLALPGIAQYHQSRSTADEKEHFARHLRKYVDIYLPDCPFEVGTVNRYTITTQEASIIARKPIKKGQPIKYLTGIQVSMTKDEEKILGDNDFSVIRSSRKKQSSLFLGPARFANHDCDANADLQTTGKHGMYIKAVKDIAVGEEITVLYGVDYFGADNCECLCGTCENLRRNGWDPRGPVIFPDTDDEEEEEEDIKPKSNAKQMSGRARSETQKKGREDSEVISKATPPSKKRKTEPPPARETKDTPTADSTQAASGEETVPARRGRGRPKKIRSEEEVAQKTPEPTVPEPVGQHSAFSSANVLTDIVEILYRVHDRMKQEPKDDETRMSAIPEAKLASKPAGEASTANAPSTREESKDNKRALPNPPHSDRRRSSKRIRGENVAEEASRPLKKSKLQHISKTSIQSPLRKVTNAKDEAAIYDQIETPEPEPAKKRTLPMPSLRKNARSRDESSSTPPSTRSSDSRQSDASSATSLDDRPNIAQGIVAQLTGSVGEGPDHFDPSEMRRRRNAISSARPSASPSEEESKDIFEFDETNQVISHRHRAATSATTATTRSTTKIATENSSKPTAPTPPIPEPAKKRHLTRSSSARDSLQPATTAINTIELPTDPDSDDENIIRGTPRIPGDYLEFIPTLYNKWTDCQNCEQLFLQGEKFQTRILCQGCERHGKLYGYEWPRTEERWVGEERKWDARGWCPFRRPEEVRREKRDGSRRESRSGGGSDSVVAPTPGVESEEVERGGRRLRRGRSGVGL